MNLPRSTVSTAISELEKLVGARLLHRTTRQVSVTLDGQSIYAKCCTIVASVEELERQFNDNTMQPRGKLRVNVPGRIGRLIIAPNLPDFLDRYPDLSIDLGVSDQSVDLIENGVDCVLRVGALVDSRLIVKNLGSIDFINVASPTYLARYGTPKSTGDLDEHWTVAYASPNTARVEPFEWMENGTRRSLQMQHKVSVNSAEGLIACALSGLGIVQVPKYDVALHLASGDLISLLPQFCTEQIPLSILYPHRSFVSPKLRVFIEWLETLMRENVFHQHER